MTTVSQRSATATHDGPAPIGAHQVSLSTRGARHRGPALADVAGLATQPGHHPGHPTAVGGLPASKPGLDAGAHDQYEDYLTVPTRCQWLIDNVAARPLSPLRSNC